MEFLSSLASTSVHTFLRCAIENIFIAWSIITIRAAWVSIEVDIHRHSPQHFEPIWITIKCAWNFEICLFEAGRRALRNQPPKSREKANYVVRNSSMAISATQLSIIVNLISVISLFPSCFLKTS